MSMDVHWGLSSTDLDEEANHEADEEDYSSDYARPCNSIRETVQLELEWRILSVTAKSCLYTSH
jgi:hypothetical protein